MAVREWQINGCSEVYTIEYAVKYSQTRRFGQLGAILLLALSENTPNVAFHTLKYWPNIRDTIMCLPSSRVGFLPNGAFGGIVSLVSEMLIFLNDTNYAPRNNEMSGLIS